MSILPECTHAHHMCAWCSKRSEEGTGHPKLELQMVMSHCLGAVSQVQVLCKSNKNAPNP